MKIHTQENAQGIFEAWFDGDAYKVGTGKTQVEAIGDLMISLVPVKSHPKVGTVQNTFIFSERGNQISKECENESWVKFGP